jgi:hypothetical protein
MIDIVMMVPAGPAVSEAALLPLPALLPVLLLFPVPVATAPTREGRAGRFHIEGAQRDGADEGADTREGCRGSAIYVKYRSRRWPLDEGG